MTKKYENIDENNKKIADLLAKHELGKEQFEKIKQEIANQAKTSNDKNVIFTGIVDEENRISFKTLPKDDIRYFWLGDALTHKPNKNLDMVGGLVFEQSIRDEKGIPTGEKRAVGLAYVWYDPNTKTVCYTDIEVPKKILNSHNHDSKIISELLVNAIVKSAEMVAISLNKNAIKVKKVSIGKGHNDLAEEFENKFGTPEYNIEL